MFELFIKAMSPFFIFLGLIILYGYATEQNSLELIEAVINLISTIFVMQPKYLIDIKTG